MLNRTKSAPQAVAERTTPRRGGPRPIVQRAMNDPELHAALRQAFDTGREVRGEVKGKPPEEDRQAHRPRPQAAAAGRDLGDRSQDAVAAVLQEPERKKGKLFRRVVTPVLVVGGVATAVFTFMKKRGGGIGPEETPY